MATPAGKPGLSDGMKDAIISRIREEEIVAMCCDEVGKLVVDVVHNFAPQTVEVDATRTHHGNGVLILGERQ